MKPAPIRRPTPAVFRSQRRRQLMLSAEEVAQMCRSAYLEFVNGDCWGKRELASWLLERYRPLARPADEAPLSTAGTRPRGDKVHPIRLRTFIEETRGTLLEDLLGARSVANRHALQQQILAAGLVAPERDVAGRTCFIPVDMPDLRLVDRLRALIVADGLATGDELAHVIVCNACNLVAFDLDTPPTWVCSSCRRQSGLRFRSELTNATELLGGGFDDTGWFKTG